MHTYAHTITIVNHYHCLPDYHRQSSSCTFKQPTLKMPPRVLPAGFKLPLTPLCKHYDNLASVPPSIQKYFHQRKSIFSFYDWDIRLTDTAWFGVTPEPVANQIAKDLSPSFSSSSQLLPSQGREEGGTIIDIFAGAGGNTIAFALSEKWTRIIAIERDADTLACAQHNAEVYGVFEQITWVHGDSFEFLAMLKETPELLDPEVRVDVERTVVFASPPWGGVGYADHEVFDLERMEPYGLRELHRACRPMGHVLFLPRTGDIRQVAELVPNGGDKIDVVQYCMRGASKAMVVYIPAEKE